MEPQSTSTGYVFISYVREDRTYVQKLASSLHKRNFETWMDDKSLESGDRWWPTIVKAIRASAAFVVVMTPKSEESEWVEREVMLALNEDKPIFPLLLDGEQFPLLGTRQHDDVRGGKMPPDEFYDQLEELVRADLSEREDKKPSSRGWAWQRHLLPLAVVALVLLVLGVGVLAFLLGAIPVFALGPEPTPTPTSTPSPTATPPPPTSTSTPPPTSTLGPPPIPTLGVGDTQVREKDGMEMVYVPGGTFQMGSTQGKTDEQPVHKVTLDGFWLDPTEVSNDQYRRCEKAGTCRAPTICEWGDPTYRNVSKADHPVVCVSWEDALAYCTWAGGRLPTEAEWEYAARGSDSHVYPWGDAAPNSTRLNYNNIRTAVAVGSYPDGASWVGALDMAGNVWEWVNDWYASDYYDVSEPKNPKGPDTGDKRVLRGGSYYDGQKFVRTSGRFYAVPAHRYYANIGFRCVVSAD